MTVILTDMRFGFQCHALHSARGSTKSSSSMRRRAGKIDFGLSSQSHIASTTLNELSGTFNVNVVTNFF